MLAFIPCPKLCQLPKGLLFVLTKHAHHSPLPSPPTTYFVTLFCSSIFYTHFLCRLFHLPWYVVSFTSGRFLHYREFYLLHTKVTVFHSYCVKYLSRRHVFLQTCSRLQAFPSFSMRFLKKIQYLGGYIASIVWWPKGRTHSITCRVHKAKQTKQTIKLTKINK